MDPTSWSAYSQHFSRLGASMNHPSGALSQQAQMNDLALSRQEHIPAYGNAGGPHPFLLAASHSLNPSQANHNDPSFNANLFAANYDASLFSSSFPAGNKGHLPSFPQGAAGLFKAVNRENDYNDLRTGFAHCGMSPYTRNSDGSNALSNSSGLGSGHIFPNSMPPSSWRHSGIIPPNCGPFGVLPHETVLQRSHLVGRGGEKLNVQGSKQSRSSIPNSSFVEQDLSRGYRTILSSPARASSSYVDSNNTSHSSLISPQSDPYFSSVSDNYYSSCSKNDFAAYSSYCNNMQSSVQRSSISPYCYSQSFGNFESNAEKSDVPTTSTKTSANPNFTNFVPNSSLNGNPSHLHNGQISRQSVITSNVSNNSAMYNSESHTGNHSYNVRESYSYHPGSSHTTTGLPSHPSESGGRNNGNRQPIAHSNNNPHSSGGQNIYPPMSTPIPASTPAHTTPPSSTMGQAYVPTPLPLSHDSGCSSVNSQSVMYHSPSNDGCYSTPGTGPSESGSPSKQDLSQHSSPSVYSIDSSNLSINSGPYADSSHIHPHSSSEVNYGNNSVINGNLSTEVIENVSQKIIEENIRNANARLLANNCRSVAKDDRLTSSLPIDMVKMNKDYQNTVVETNYNRRTNSVQNQSHSKHPNVISSRPDCNINRKGSDFSCSPNESGSALDFTPKDKGKANRKRKSDESINSSPLNCTYSHLQNNQTNLTSKTNLSSPDSNGDTQECKKDLPSISVKSNESIPVEEDLPIVNDSPVPVDLSQMSSMKLSMRKIESSIEKEDLKEDLPNLKYETHKSGGKWSLTKQDNSIQNEEQNDDCVKEIEDIVEKDKDDIPLCRTPSMVDDLSDESKKLCNSIEDLGFLAGLSSDVDDSASKSSFSEKKSKREKGLLQSFLTFLESSNDPPVPTDPVSLNIKSELKEDSKSSKDEDADKRDNSCIAGSSKAEDEKSIIVETDDKDNFDEAPSLDPSLFGCSSLQKEMVVPNPEAPSFSSDEDENSTQDIFDSVAMAIQRLCEDNEEDHSEKSKSSSKSSFPKKEMPETAFTMEAECASEKIKDDNEPSKEMPVEQCSIKSARVVRRRGKRRKALIVIKVKRNEEKPPVSRNIRKASNRNTRKTDKAVQGSKGLQNSQRRVLMRKCKEKDTRSLRSGSKKRKTRNCVKRKYVFEENEDNSIIADTKDESSEIQEIEDVTEEKEAGVNKNVKSSSARPAKSVKKSESCNSLLSTGTESKQALPMEVYETPLIDLTGPSPAKVPATERQLSAERSPGSAAARRKRIQRNPYRTRKRRRKSIKKSLQSEKPGIEPEPQKIVEPEAANTSSSENFDTQFKERSLGNNENCLNTETHFKTGDYVINIENQDSLNPPIWRIEGKNVLQLFEVLEKEGSNGNLYRNTSSYSRLSPSSKHKYVKQPVRVIESDDDTVIVEVSKTNDIVVEQSKEVVDQKTTEVIDEQISDVEFEKPKEVFSEEVMVIEDEVISKETNDVIAEQTIEVIDKVTEEIINEEIKDVTSTDINEVVDEEIKICTNEEIEEVLKEESDKDINKVTSEIIAEIDLTDSCDYVVHPEKESFEIYLQILISHALDIDFIPAIVKDNDEYFLIHYQKIEEITALKKSYLNYKSWTPQLFTCVELYPYVDLILKSDADQSSCKVCSSSKIEYTAHFHGHAYDPMTLENIVDFKNLPECDFPLCGSCIQPVTLYSRLHHHKYHFFLLSCKKVKEVKKEDDSAILEECLADTDWISQMFKDMVEMWSACDKYR